MMHRPREKILGNETGGNGGKRLLEGGLSKGRGGGGSLLAESGNFPSQNLCSKPRVRLRQLPTSLARAAFTRF